MKINPLKQLKSYQIESSSNNRVVQRLTSKMIVKLAAVTLSSLFAVSAVIGTAQADVSNADVQAYATAMKSAANAQNIDKVAQLISDDALISITRKNKSGTMSKDKYLKRLQDNWKSTNNYRYSIRVDNVVSTGSKAKADITTTENFVKDGREVKFVTKSRATLTEGVNNAMLLKAVSQVTIE